MYNINHNFTYRQKDKGWQVILSYKDGDKWRQKSKQGLKTKQQAKAAGDKLLSELQRTFVPSSNELAGTTLREFVPIVIKDKKLAPSTKYAYGRVPVFFADIADKVVSQITTSDIIRVVATKKGVMYDSAPPSTAARRFCPRHQCIWDCYEESSTSGSQGKTNKTPVN